MTSDGIKDIARETGGPAYPHPVAIGPGGDVYSPHDVCAPGMSLRDWFAGQAMTAWDGTWFEGTAAEMYRRADAMLAERSKP